MSPSKRAFTESRRQTKDERLQLRVTPTLKRQLADVAHSHGLSMSDFATQAISEAVTKARYERHVIEVSHEESVWLAELLASPPPPSDHMIATAARYKRLIRP